MTKKIFLALVFFGNTLLFGQTGRIKGKVMDAENKEELPFANIQLEQNGKVLLNAAADLAGDFFITGLPPGIYDLKVACVGYKIMQQNGIIVLADRVTQESIKMEPSAVMMSTVVIYVDNEPIDMRCHVQYKELICELNSCTATCCMYYINGGVFSDSAEVEEKIKPEETVSCTISPNPFMDLATIEIASGITIEDGSMQLFDVAGNEIRSLKFSGQSVIIERQGLAAGIYMYRVNSGDKQIAAGRMVVQ